MLFRTRYRFILFLMMVFSAAGCSKYVGKLGNPLLPSGADPWAIYKKPYYYYTQTYGDSIVIWRTKSMRNLPRAERKTVFVPPAGTAYSKQIWAPEIHFIDNNWYIYFAADDGKNENHRIYALHNPSADPFNGSFQFKGKIADSSDKWAIDASVFNYRDTLYMVWSGWEGDINGRQDIFIARMSNPLQVQTQRVRVSTPFYDWERHGDLNDPDNPPHVAVNEGPQILMGRDSLYLVYSASGCWTDHYCLGMLSLSRSADLLDSSAWIKKSNPVFETNISNGVYAPGHNSFFTSPNGKRDYILYHANSHPNEGCGRRRSPRAQQFFWNKNGSPEFGAPVKTF
jgi:GH43 family beta-xylosidase